MESFTVELNQNKAVWSRPGEFECALSQPILINDGDALGFKMASIDSNISDQDTILIEQDQKLTMTFSYYDVDYDQRDKFEYYPTLPDSNTVPWAVTYNYYAAYNEFQYVKLTELQMKIIGYYPPTQSIFHDGLVAGSFVIGNTGPYAGINPSVNMIMYFTYIDQSNVQQTIGLTGSNAMSYPNPNPRLTNPIFRVQPGTDDVPEGNILMELPEQDIIYRAGTFKFVGVKGYWPGELNNPSSQTFNYSPGCFIPGYGGGTPNTFSNSQQLLPSNFTFGAIRIENVGTQSLQLDKRIATINLPAGRYQPQALAVQMTQMLSDANGVSEDLTLGTNNQVYAPNNPLLIRTDAPENAAMIFTPIAQGLVQNVFNTGTSYVYQSAPDPTPGVKPAYYVGANTVALEYGVAGEVFQMTYCHMPLSDPADPGQQSIGLYTISGPIGPDGPTDTQYKVITAASGIAIHDLQPVSFWQDVLGLRNKLVVPLLRDENDVEYYTMPSLMKSITMGFQGLGTFFLPPVSNGANPPVYPDFRKMSPLVPTDNPRYINITGQSKAIIGDTTSVNRRGGYYLIEILNVFRSNTGGYIDDTENRRQISAIVSTQMSNNNSITGYQDGDCIAYTHKGLPYMISSAVVRILDPITKTPVTSLGPNNTVFLQIQKAIQQVVEQQASKPKPKVVRKIQVPPELR